MPKQKPKLNAAPSLLGWLFGSISLLVAVVFVYVGGAFTKDIFRILSHQRLEQGLATQNIDDIERFSSVLISPDNSGGAQLFRLLIGAPTTVRAPAVSFDMVKVAVYLIRDRTYGTLELIEELIAKGIFSSAFSNQNRDSSAFAKRYEKTVEQRERIRTLKDQSRSLLEQKESFEQQHELIIRDLYEYFQVLPDKENPPEPGRLYTEGILKGLPVIAGIPDDINGVVHLRGVLRSLDGRERDYTNNEMEEKIISLQLVFRSIDGTLSENTNDRARIEQEMQELRSESENVQQTLYQELSDVIVKELKPDPFSFSDTAMRTIRQWLQKK